MQLKQKQNVCVTTCPTSDDGSNSGLICPLLAKSGVGNGSLNDGCNDDGGISGIPCISYSRGTAAC
jgi:hypothetical protein